MSAEIALIVPRAGQDMAGSGVPAPQLPPWMVPRRRLDDLIARGAEDRLTLVTGPPGAGKTVAVSSWAAGRVAAGRAAAERGTGERRAARQEDTSPVVWLDAARAGDQPETFWEHLIGAFGACGVGSGEPVRVEDGRADRRLLLGLAAELAGRERPVPLVLDDLHLVTRQEVYDDLVWLMDRAGLALRVIVSARSEPPLPLAHFLLAGQITRVQTADLAFTMPEARLLLARHDVTVSQSALSALMDRTQGWAAGLRLAAAAIQEGARPEQFALAGRDDGVVDSYLIREAFDPQPAATRDLLLTASALEHISGALATELTGDSQAAARLAALAEPGGFVQPAGPGQYRLSPLFGHALRGKLGGQSQRDAAELRRQAAQWLSGQRQRGARDQAGRHGHPAGRRHSGDPVVAEQLTARELEVLRLISGLLMTDEIADELCLSANTIRTHVRNILRKLGAARRGEAVRRARELYILLPRGAVRTIRRTRRHRPGIIRSG